MPNQKINEQTSDVLAKSSRDAARMLGISERTLWSYTKSGDIPHVRLGRRILYPIQALRDWMQRIITGGK